MEFIIISGLSGAGKSKVASFLEDIGFYVVDNMPAPLMPKFAELCMAGPGRYDRVALVTDIRGGQTFDGLFDALHELHRMGCAYKILFVEASVETIIKRYKETRRMHPLSSTSRSLDEGVYSFVFGYQQTKDFMAHLESLIGFLLPQYVEEGKAALVIGIGCTGGQHRSVAITKALADFIKQKGYQATENHRDMTRA